MVRNFFNFNSSNNSIVSFENKLQNKINTKKNEKKQTFVKNFIGRQKDKDTIESGTITTERIKNFDTFNHYENIGNLANHDNPVFSYISNYNTVYKASKNLK